MKHGVIFFVCLLLMACEEKPKDVKVLPKPVKTMLIKGKTTKQMRTFIGKVSASKKAELSFEVSGKIASLNVMEGDEVKKGRPLASLDDKRFKEKVEQATAKYKLDLAQYNRAKGLIEKNYVSKSEYDILKSKVQISLSNLENARKNLKDTVIYAPFYGLIAKTYKENHEHVKAKEVVISLKDLSQLDVEIQIPEYIAKQLKTREAESKRGKQNVAHAVFDDFPNASFPLAFSEFTSTADENTQTYRVIFTMPAPKKINVLPGMSVSVNIEVPDYKNKKQAYFLIPSSSVFSNLDKKPLVWIVDEKTMTLRSQAIKTSSLSGDKIKVLSGLKAGDRIVTAGVHFLRKGQKVRLINTKDKR